MLKFHSGHSAEVTLGCMEVVPEQASRFGTIELGPDRRVKRFHEKPVVADKQGRALVSLGIYVFDREALEEALRADALAPGSRHDLGRDIIPRMVAEDRLVLAYDATEEQAPDGFYWRDIGVIDAYWEVGMKLLEDGCPFDLYDPEWTIFSYQAASPPARVRMQTIAGCGLDRSLLCPVATVTGARIDKSILSTGVNVESGAKVVESVLLNDVHLGRGARVRRAIIGKGTVVPDGYAIGIDRESDRCRFYVSPGGIAVVADIVPRCQLERKLDPYAFEMAPMGGSISTN